MSIYYQDKDKFIDYELYRFDDHNLPHKVWLRGPKPNGRRESITCIGAANIFGRFCEYPFSKLISETMDVDVFNFGLGGVGPSHSLFREPKVLDIINKSKCCIVGVMSGRSESCSEFLTDGGTIGRDLILGKNTNVGEFWKDRFENHPLDHTKKLLSETIDAYINSYNELSSMIKVPTILVNISRFNPVMDYRECESITDIKRIFKFPHFISDRILDEVSEFFDYQVYQFGEKCEHSQSNLVGRQISHIIHSDGAVIENGYYSTPNQHTEVFIKLQEILNELLYGI